jgi:hypothetical protein
MVSEQIPNQVHSVGPRVWAVPDQAVRLVGALLALAVSAVHIADQGSVTAFTSPDWIGWGYRLIEAGGVLTAIALLLPALAVPPQRSANLPWSGLSMLGWGAGVLLGTGPFLAYIASRTIGVPGDPGDVGNWGYWVGTVSLLVEAALIALSASMLLASRRSGQQRLASSRVPSTRKPKQSSDSPSR